VPDALADRRSARFADEHRLHPRTGKILGEQVDLGALAAPLGSFETDEETCLTRVRHARIMIVDERDCRAKQENVLRRGGG
jgi:hypothetical protein